MMTAVLTVALLAGPAALLVAGPLLEQWGAQNVFLLVAAGELIGSLPFVFVALRRRGTRPRPRSFFASASVMVPKVLGHAPHRPQMDAPAEVERAGREDARAGGRLVVGHFGVQAGPEEVRNHGQHLGAGR